MRACATSSMRKMATTWLVAGLALVSSVGQVALAQVELGDVQPTVIGAECNSLDSETMSIGTVCADFPDENLEVNITVTQSNCVLEETHICNMPDSGELKNLNLRSYTYSIPVDEVYDFVCSLGGEQTYVVAGHATVKCDGSLTDRGNTEETFHAAYYEIQLGCPDAPDENLDQNRGAATCGPRAWSFLGNLACDDPAKDSYESCLAKTEAEGADEANVQYIGYTVGPFKFEEYSELKVMFYTGTDTCDESEGDEMARIEIRWLNEAGEEVDDNPTHIGIDIEMADGWMLQEEFFMLSANFPVASTSNPPIEFQPSEFPFSNNGMSSLQSRASMVIALSETEMYNGFGYLSVAARSQLAPVETCPNLWAFSADLECGNPVEDDYEACLANTPSENAAGNVRYSGFSIGPIDFMQYESMLVNMFEGSDQCDGQGGSGVATVDIEYLNDQNLPVDTNPTRLGISVQAAEGYVLQKDYVTLSRNFPKDGYANPPYFFDPSEFTYSSEVLSGSSSATMVVDLSDADPFNGFGYLSFASRARATL